MGGDFNLVMDVQKDKKGGNATTHRNSLKEVQNIANSLDLIDVWRTLNPDGKRFTWRRTKPEVHCRLDYFMISSSLTTAITNADILPGYKTNHSLIHQLNTSFLLDSEQVVWTLRSQSIILWLIQDGDEIACKAAICGGKQNNFS